MISNLRVISTPISFDIKDYEDKETIFDKILHDEERLKFDNREPGHFLFIS